VRESGGVVQHSLIHVIFQQTSKCVMDSVENRVIAIAKKHKRESSFCGKGDQKQIKVNEFYEFKQ